MEKMPTMDKWKKMPRMDKWKKCLGWIITPSSPTRNHVITNVPEGHTLMRNTITQNNALVTSTGNLANPLGAHLPQRNIHIASATPPLGLEDFGIWNSRFGRTSQSPSSPCHHMEEKTYIYRYRIRTEPTT